MSCLDSWDEACLLFLACVGGYYSTDSGTNKYAGVFKNVYFLGFPLWMLGLFLPVSLLKDVAGRCLKALVRGCAGCFLVKLQDLMLQQNACLEKELRPLGVKPSLSSSPSSSAMS